MANQLIRLDNKHISGIQLQMYRLPFLHPQVDLPYEFTFIIWWNNPARHNGILTGFEDIRLALDQQTEEEV
ncbi:hypothetical protein J1N35_041757, partial [Gossypium stocksii]